MLFRYSVAKFRVVVVLGDVLFRASLLVIYRETLFRSVRRRVDLYRISETQRFRKGILTVQRYSELAGILGRRNLVQAVLQQWYC